MKTALPLTLLALVASASAQIDSGGGKSAVGTMNNHASTGGVLSALSPQDLVASPDTPLPCKGPCPAGQRVADQTSFQA